MSLSSSHRSRRVVLPLLLVLISCLPSVLGQAISTSMPVPPLQWIQLTELLGGSAAPPLKDATIGYDSTNRLLLIFGGESQQGFPTHQTYTLDLRTLQWSTPTAPNGLDQRPSERSAFISGDDSAASYRHGHIVIDGEGLGGSAAGDVWEFDYTSKFWAQVGVESGGPSARWGAVGGIDPRTSDPSGATLFNNVYMAGGYDGKTIYNLSEVWRFRVSGTLSSNLPKDVTASWTRVKIGQDIPGRVSMGGTAVGQQIVAVGGCKSAASTQSILDASCAVQDSQIIDTSSGNVRNPSPCIAPRIDPAVVPNMNAASDSFGQQAFVLFGTFNNSMWDDGGGLNRGEVAVLDVGTGAWARVLPAGDPGSDGKPTYPVPRQGAAALSWSTPLVGDIGIPASDTIIFGGRDASGNYLSDVWLLRSYNGTLTKSGQKWNGFGSGSLTSGITANGEGVTVEYMTQCALSKGGSSTSTTGSPTSGGPSSTSSSGTNTGTGSSDQSGSSNVSAYNTSVVHKSLGALSVALFLPALVLHRLSAPSVVSGSPIQRNLALLYLGVIVGVAAYALGIVGLATSFTSITSTSLVTKRALSSGHLQTSHGKAGLALFAGLYGLVPVLQLLALALSSTSDSDQVDSRIRVDSATEKMSVNGRAVSPSQRSEALSNKGEGKKRIRSWAGIGTWTGISPRRSNDTTTDDRTQTPSQQSFEVVNRPARQRRASGNSLAAFSDPRPTHRPRNLSDMSWLAPRRSTSGLGGEFGAVPLDRREPWTPGTTQMEVTSTNGLVMSQSGLPQRPVLPSPFSGFIHVLFHLLLLALSGLSLAALWLRAPVAAFAIFLAWTVTFYAIILILAWHGRPRESILSVIFSRLRAEPIAFTPIPRTGSPMGSRPMSMNESVAVPFPSDGRGPYQNHPPHRTAFSEDYPMTTSHGHMSTDDYDDEEDEDTRQRRIEEELNRRDVSIVTVPKRRLFLLNPNPPEEEGS